MRKSFWTGATFAALAAVAAGAYLGHWASPQPSPPPSAPAEATIPTTVSPPDAPLAVAPPAPVERPDDLPTVAVGQRPVHIVREDENLPIPTVTLTTRDGRVIARAAPRPTPLAAAPPRQSLTAPVGGAAQAVGGTRLAVAGRTLELFGVETPATRRCALGDNAILPCPDAAREALRNRLAGNPKVTCDMPAGQRGKSAFICRDASGLDLGGFLVAEGLAFADTSQSYDYLGVQDVARSFRRGLWRVR